MHQPKDYGRCNTVNKLDNKTHELGCRRIHTESPKATESELAIEIVTDLSQQGHTTDAVGMDDDSATIVRLSALVNDKIAETIDTDHVKKCLSFELYKMKENSGSLRSKNAIIQNKGDKDHIEKTIQTVVPHWFGDHSKCIPSCCKFLQTPDTYIHRSLPDKRPLKRVHLRKDLERVFNTLSDNAEKYADLDSSQPNESTDQIISSKGPESKHFAVTESLGFRVSAEGLQRNKGQEYLLQINESKHSSPAKYTACKFIQMDLKQKPATVRQKHLSPKVLKRRSKKSSKMKSQASQEVREGVTCQAGRGLHELDGDILKAIHPSSPKSQPLPSTQTDETMPPDVVVFKLETTGFDELGFTYRLSSISDFKHFSQEYSDSSVLVARLIYSFIVSAGNEIDIIQIAALILKSQSTLSMYINPEKPIHPNASKVNHLYKRQGVLFKDNMALETHSKKEVLQKFISWLPESCILAGHNSKAFGSKILVKSLIFVNLFDEFKLKCSAFLDTLSLCKDIYPNRKANGKGYRLGELVYDLVEGTYDVHDAKAMVKALSKLLDHLHMSDEKMKDHSFSVYKVYEAYVRQTRKLKQFQPHTDSKRFGEKDGSQ